MKIYLASPFFTEEQNKRLDSITQIVKNNGYDYFSPREFFIIDTKHDKDIRKQVFEKNLEEIKSSDIIISVTDGRDLGTLFETGYAFSLNKIIIGFYSKAKTEKFNLMLAESCYDVASDFRELDIILKRLKTENDITKKYYAGMVE